MTLVNNSSFKVQGETVATSAGVVPEKGALLFDENLNTHVLGNGTAWVPVLVEPYADTFFVDMLGPLSGVNLDSAANISDLLTIGLWRDTTNVSGLFAGADPSALNEYASDLDVHVEIDTPGSRQEYVK